MIEKQYKIFFGTLANETRLAIAHTLLDGSKSVTEIQRALRCDQSMVSHNLKRMERCHFVSVKQNGKQRIYSLNKETIEPLLKLMDKHVNTYCKKLCC